VIRVLIAYSLKLIAQIKKARQFVETLPGKKMSKSLSVPAS